MADVRLLPYQRCLLGRNALALLWQMVEAEGNTGDIFYAQHCADESLRGDVVEFITYFSSDTRQLLIAVRDAGEPFGLVWFDAVPGQAYALMGLWYQRHTTTMARAATAEAMTYALTVLGYEGLRGFTPHRTAVQHVLPLGWKKVATLPRFLQITGQARDVYVLSYEPKE